MVRKDYPSLTELDLELTYRCPRRCVYCSQEGFIKALFGSARGAKARELSTEKICSLLKQARRLGVEWVNFSGGEPTLRADLIDLIAEAARLGLKTGLVTKAIFDEEAMGRLKSAGLTRLGLSLDSHIPRIANKLVGDPDYFKGCLKNIRMAKRVGLEVMLLPVLSQLVLKEFPEYLKFAEKCGVDLVRPQPYQHQPSMSKPYGKRVSWERIKDLCLQNRDEAMAGVMSLDSPVLEKEKTDHSSKRRRKGGSSPERLARCSIGRGKLLIQPDGKAYFCGLITDYVVGNVRRDTLHKIWYRGKIRDILFPKRKMFRGTRCYECVYFKLCTEIGRCAYNAKANYGRIFAPDPWLCNQFLNCDKDD